ncbi:hypothetical protein GY45DRAFT_926816 [Cubamyces sp. BRFM 1775]|nr:hypothetical protein GY45DRAFT_926816 [Cubamyces sp. BRFM 1775]
MSRLEGCRTGASRRSDQHPQRQLKQLRRVLPVPREHHAIWTILTCISAHVFAHVQLKPIWDGLECVHVHRSALLPFPGFRLGFLTTSTASDTAIGERGDAETPMPTFDNHA